MSGHATGETTPLSPDTSHSVHSTFAAQQTSSSLMILLQYQQEARVLSAAYTHRELDFLWLSKALTYPAPVLSAVLSILTTTDVHRYVLMGLSIVATALAGLNTVVGPQRSAHASNTAATEFDQIASSVSQFLSEGHTDAKEIAAFSKTVHRQLEAWKNAAPTPSPRYLNKAKRGSLCRARPSLPGTDTVSMVVANASASNAFVPVSAMAPSAASSPASLAPHISV